MNGIRIGSNCITRHLPAAFLAIYQNFPVRYDPVYCLFRHARFRGLFFFAQNCKKKRADRTQPYCWACGYRGRLVKCDLDGSSRLGSFRDLVGASLTRTTTRPERHSAVFCSHRQQPSRTPHSGRQLTELNSVHPWTSIIIAPVYRTPWFTSVIGRPSRHPCINTATSDDGPAVVLSRDDELNPFECGRNDAATSVSDWPR